MGTAPLPRLRASLAPTVVRCCCARLFVLCSVCCVLRPSHLFVPLSALSSQPPALPPAGDMPAAPIGVMDAQAALSGEQFPPEVHAGIDPTWPLSAPSSMRRPSLRHGRPGALTLEQAVAYALDVSGVESVVSIGTLSSTQ
jgi:hypothetical protein